DRNEPCPYGTSVLRYFNGLSRRRRRPAEATPGKGGPIPFLRDNPAPRGSRVTPMSRPGGPGLSRPGLTHSSSEVNYDATNSSWIHPDRAVGGDRDHRRADRAGAAGGAGGAGGGAAESVRQ